MWLCTAYVFTVMQISYSHLQYCNNRSSLHNNRICKKRYCPTLALTTLIGHWKEDVTKEGDLQNVPLHSNDNVKPSWVLSLLQSSCWQLLHHPCMKERRLYLRVGVSTSAKKILSVDYLEMRGASARSGHPRWWPSQTRASLLETSIRHIYMAAMLRSICQHSRGAIAWGNPWAHGLHDNNNQGEQGIIRVRVEELWHTVSQACSVKEGHQVVGYQPHHLRQMFHGNKKESTYIGVSCVWRSPMTWRTAAIGILQNAV